MINFVFILNDISATDISPFDLGDIEIIGLDSIISSKEKLPSQSMMLFISICELLDKIRNVLANKRVKYLIFSSVDSSFGLRISREKENIILSDGNNEVKASIKELYLSLYASCASFYDEYSYVLENRHHYYDLKDSLTQFKSYMKDSLKLDVSDL